MELVHIAGILLGLLFLVFSCEGLPVEVPRVEGLEGEELDRAIALANSDLDLLELDIVLPPRAISKEGLGEGEERKRRDLIADYSKLWVDGVVPYVFPSFISDEGRSMVKAGMDHWMNHTCIRFVERTTEKDYILFVESVGCWSSVGRQGGEQMLSVGDESSRENGCGRMGVMAHELAHALGFWHEQSRTDRDDHITIVTENIHPLMLHNFDKYEHDLTDPLGVKYDYDSIMHYGETAFSMNGRPTIIPTEEGAKIGQRTGLSPLDIEQANLMYKCTVAAEETEETPLEDAQPPPSEEGQQARLIVKNSGNGKCLAARGKEVVLVPCNISLLSQQWTWNGYHQLANYDSKLCITAGKSSAVHLESCDNHVTSPQEWLCAEQHIIRPTEGECLSSKGTPQGGDELDEMMQELQGFLEPTKVTWSTCTLNAPFQKWQVHGVVGGVQAADLTGSAPCAASPSNALQQCYNETRSNGQLKCRYRGMFARGLIPAATAGDPPSGLECCASPRMFTGSPNTALHPSNLSCVHESWLQPSSPRVTSGFTCPEGYYLNSINYGKGERSNEAHSATCCTDRPIQTMENGAEIEASLASYINCYPAAVVGESEGSHYCHSGYYVAHTFKAKCSEGGCQEEVKCCF